MNFLGQALNSTFDLMFVQHEPGPLCTTLIDKPFTQNYDECLRYFSKSYPYAVKPGTVDSHGAPTLNLAPVPNWAGVWTWVPFPKWMAKQPTIVGFSAATGASNVVRDGSNAVDRAISSVNAVGESGFSGFTISGQATTGNPWYQFHYTADTGW
jgi:hypothetical protein